MVPLLLKEHLEMGLQGQGLVLFLRRVEPT